jgi:DNA recombination protein RmuC
MENKTLILILLALVAILILILVIVIINNRNQIKMMSGKLEQSDAKVNDEFIVIKSFIRDEINMFNENTSSRVKQMEDSVNVNLNTSFEKVSERLVKVDESQKNLNKLSDEIISLQDILTDKKTRGIFGEIELYNLLDNIYNEGQYIKQYKLSNGNIVDAVLKGPKNLGMIAIDSKFPLENYNRIFDKNLSSQQIAQVKNEFQRNIVKHLKDIETKYLHNEELAEIGFMFIPAESIYAYIYANMQSIVELSYKLKVYIVSPTTLMAYLTAYKAINLDIKRNDRLKDIQNEYIKLSNEFQRFVQRSEQVFKDYDRMYKDIQLMKITSNKLIKRFKEIELVELDSSDEDENRKEEFI